MKYSLYLLLLPVLFLQCRKKEEIYTTQFPGKPEVPSSIKNEHEFLLDQVKSFALFQDSTGAVAIKLAELMQHHFKEEEDFVLPPLGLLPFIADGKIPQQREEIIRLTEKLKSQLAHLNAEHQFIIAFTHELSQAAAQENHPEIRAFENALHKHAQTEEEIYFPAALLVGDYLKIQTR